MRQRDNKEQRQRWAGNQKETVPETQTHSWARKVASKMREWPGPNSAKSRGRPKRKQEGETEAKEQRAQTRDRLGKRKRGEAGRGKAERAETETDCERHKEESRDEAGSQHQDEEKGEMEKGRKKDWARGRGDRDTEGCGEMTEGRKGGRDGRQRGMTFSSPPKLIELHQPEPLNGAIMNGLVTGGVKGLQRDISQIEWLLISNERLWLGNQAPPPLSSTAKHGVGVAGPTRHLTCVAQTASGNGHA